MALTHALSTNNYGNPKFIVATSLANGTHTTLATAMADAVSGDTIALRDSVTENVTITPGVNIISLSDGGSLNVPSITGTLTMTGAGTSTISGLRLVTNSAALIAVTGSAASILNVKDCYLNCSNNTGITFSTSSSSASLNLYNCLGNIGTTGITLFSHSSAGQLLVQNTFITNTGAAVTASTVSAGSFNTSWSNFQFPITLSGTGSCTLQHSIIANSGLNTTMLTLGGSGIQNFKWCRIESGTASAVTISTTAVFTLCIVDSTNTNAITGAGTITYSGMTFTNTSTTINTTTQTGSGTLQGSKNTAPAAGYLGEQISSAVTGVSLSTGTPKSLTSISITAGVWDVTALGTVVSSTNVGSAGIIGISATNNTFEGNEGDKRMTLNPAAANWNTFAIAVPTFRIVLTATTTYYVIAQLNFGSGTGTGNGRITAVRVA